MSEYLQKVSLEFPEGCIDQIYEALREKFGKELVGVKIDEQDIDTGEFEFTCYDRGLNSLLESLKEICTKVTLQEYEFCEEGSFIWDKGDAMLEEASPGTEIDVHEWGVCEVVTPREFIEKKQSAIPEDEPSSGPAGYGIAYLVQESDGSINWYPDWDYHRDTVLGQRHCKFKRER